MQKLIFVYGTLKPDNYNNHLLKGQENLGEITVQIPYRMATNGSYPCLYKVLEPEPVTGFLYKVDDSCLERVYSLEGYSGVRGDSSNWYDTDDVETPHGNAEFFYFGTKPRNWRDVPNNNF